MRERVFLTDPERRGKGKDTLQNLTNIENPKGSLPLCPAEDIFLCRLIQKDFIKEISDDELTSYVEEALALRQSSTLELLKLLKDIIDDQMERPSDAMTKIDDMMKEEANDLQEVIDTLHAKHKKYTFGIQNSINECLQEKSDIKHLASMQNIGVLYT
ncbi:hypothetical protein VNO80_15555 [Phaseolus coccineus]|uniref:Uncharacterized protein n=1 Tax=Phaseolus coccineus TaxID=3886 RepID=A0AAN9MQI6_PHACN